MGAICRMQSQVYLYHRYKSDVPYMEKKQVTSMESVVMLQGLTSDITFGSISVTTAIHDFSKHFEQTFPGLENTF